MKENYIVEGLFYSNNGHLCRKYLDIKSNNTDVAKPDLMVIMMNPGSSKPEDGNDNNSVKSKAVPDKTQIQIIKIMENCNYNYTRILNLSDLRESKSDVFYSKLNSLSKVPDSVFSDERIEDFKSLFVKETPVIYAWGVNSKLEHLALQAIRRINIKNPIGILKEGTLGAYYHPLPQRYAKQQEWLEQITLQLKKFVHP